MESAIHPQYITDTAGEKLVVLTISDYNKIMEQVEDIEDIELYDEAKKEDTGERILFSDYLKERKVTNG